MRVGTRDIVRIGRVGAAVDGVRARLVGVGARSAVIIDRALVPTPGRRERTPPGRAGRACAIVESGLRIVIGGAWVQAAAEAAAAVVTIEERFEVGGTRGCAARNDRGTISAIRCGVYVKVEGQRISTPYESTVRWCIGISVKVVRIRLHAACDDSDAATDIVQGSPRGIVNRIRILAAGEIAASVVNGEGAVVVGCLWVCTARSDDGA